MRAHEKRSGPWVVLHCVLLAFAAAGPLAAEDKAPAEAGKAAAAGPTAAAEPRELLFTDVAGQPLREILQRFYLTASARIRPEYNNNLADFNTTPDDELGFISSRFRIGAGADFAHGVGLFFEAQNNSNWGDDSVFSNSDASNDQDGLDVYQAFIQAKRIKDTDFGLRIGRQELVYGSEMLLGDADFGPGLSHDAVKLMYDGDPISIHAWFAKEVDGTVSAAPTPLDSDVDFWGVYGMFKCCRGTGLDAYWLFLRDPRTGLDDKRHTLGTRGYAALCENLSVDSEIAWQFGRTGVEENSIRAFAYEGGLHASFPDVCLRPSASLGYAYATGDSDPSDSRDGTFSPLFEDNHPRLGLSDILSLQNLHAPYVKAVVNPCGKLGVGSSYHLFWADRTEDTTAPANLTPGATTGGSHFIGQEVDVFFNYQCTKNLSGQLAWAHIIPGDYISRRFDERDLADRLYLHMVLGF